MEQSMIVETITRMDSSRILVNDAVNRNRYGPEISIEIRAGCDLSTGEPILGLLWSGFNLSIVNELNSIGRFDVLCNSLNKEQLR